MEAYLDNSATTRPTPGVVAAISECMTEGFFNPSSLYMPALNAERQMKACRAELAGELRVSADAVCFTSGGTESNNLAITGTVSARRGTSHAVTFETEHPSVLETVKSLAAHGHSISVLPVDTRGIPDMDALENALASKPALVSVMQVNNETGAVPDIPEIARLIRGMSPETLLHVDGVQGFMRLPFDARTVDLYTASAHKIHGPKGVGMLYIRPGVRINPLFMGGGQERGVRSGTENTPGIAGLFAAVHELRALPALKDALLKKKLKMHDLFLRAVPDMKVLGPDVCNGAPHILNVSLPPVRAEVMLHALEGDGVYCSTGAACSSKKRKISAVLAAMNTTPAIADCALRFSLSPYTADDEIEYAAECLARRYAQLKQYNRR